MADRPTLERIPAAAGRRAMDRISPTARSILARLSLANFGGAALVFVYLTFVVPTPPAGKAVVDAHHRLSLFLFLGYVVALLPLTTMHALRRLSPVDDWQASHQPADETIQRVLLAQPMRQAVTAFMYWVLGAAVFGAFNGLVLGAGVSVTLR
ncbi:MAG TPA: hypothetical protein VNY84_05660, partial [Acidimicrobiales bacterium]|nr:hypothetical protein [Acidimicrobiales bacterium]